MGSVDALRAGRSGKRLQRRHQLRLQLQHWRLLPGAAFATATTCCCGRRLLGQYAAAAAAAAAARFAALCAFPCTSFRRNIMHRLVGSAVLHQPLQQRFRPLLAFRQGQASA
jgi:hypothetical protein